MFHATLSFLFASAEAAEYGSCIESAVGKRTRQGMSAAEAAVGLQVVEPKVNPTQRLLRFIWLLSGSKQSEPLEISRLFAKVLDLSSKGYLDYGFKPGRWVTGKKEFMIRSEGFASDLGFLAKQGYIEIERDHDVIKVLPPGRLTAEGITLESELEALGLTQKVESPRLGSFRTSP